MECKFQNRETFADVAGQSSKNWNSSWECSKELIVEEDEGDSFCM